MKEFFKYLGKFDFKNLFVTPTNNSFIQFFRYVFVGGAAFLVDAGILFLLELVGMNYLIAAIFAFIAGLVANYVMSKFLVFQKSNINGKLEFVFYAIIGLIGLGLTELFMYLFTGVIGLYFMLSKIIVAVIVLIWNFLARKLILYRNI